MNREAFSLIELLAVLAIISIIAVSASVRWGSSYKSVTFQAAVDSLVDLDATARSGARRFGTPAKIGFSIGSRDVICLRWGNGGEEQRDIRLSESTVVANLISTNGALTEGSYWIDISREGTSTTYGIEIVQDDRSLWIVFAGRSGQPLFFQHRRQVDELFKTLWAERINAN